MTIVFKELQWSDDKFYGTAGRVGAVMLFSYCWAAGTKREPEKPYLMVSYLPGQGSYWCKDQETCKRHALTLLNRFADLVVEAVKL